MHEDGFSLASKAGYDTMLSPGPGIMNMPTPDEIRRVMAELGRRGGKVMSPRKLAAIRRNAKLGGMARHKAAKKAKESK
jgi:hypothetical protein